MANLVPLSSSSLVKPKKSAIIKADKFLAKAPKSSSAIVKYSDKSSQTLEGDNTLKEIQKKVIKIDNLLKDSLVLSKKEGEKKRVSEEQKDFDKREKELEKNKPKAIPGIKLPSPPKLGIFDWIKNFITQTILGFIFVRLIDHLPKLLKLVPIIFKAGEFLIDMGGKLLDGLVTFIDWGYKAYDATRGFVKNIFGEGGVKQFDSLMSTLNKLSQVIILASLASAMPGGGPGKFIKDTLLQRGAQQAGQTAATQVGGAASSGAGAGGAATGGAATGATQAGGTATQAGSIGTGAVAGIIIGAGLLASALGEGAFQVRKFAVKPIQNLEREYKKDKNPFTKIGRGVVLNMVRPLYGLFSTVGFLLDVIGAPFRYAIELLRFPFLSEEDKQKQAYNLAKFDARIREDFRKALNLVTLGFAFKEKGSFGNIYGNKGAQQDMMSKMAGGGSPTTRGGKLVGGPARRTLKKKKKSRTLSFTPRKIRPGANVGGEAKVQSVFPNPEKAWWDPLGVFTGKPQQSQQSEKSKEKQPNPQEFLINSNEVLGKSDYFGPFFTLAIKSVLGQKPDLIDYKNAGKGLNSWMQTTFKSGSLGFAGGGEVDASEFFRGEDYTNVIAKSVEDSVSKEVDTTIRDLAKELSLRSVGREEMVQENIDQGIKQKPDPNLDVGSGGTVSGGNADFWTLVAISRMEDSDPQGSADVAQSIYNRVASGIYGGKTIKEIVLRQGQYEPTWKYPRGGKKSIPNPEWYNIKDLASASIATGISQSDLQRTAAALRNPTYQEEARKFVGGRTDFMGGGNIPGPGDIRRKGNEPNNFFGWFVGPAAKSYGARNPGPARAPQLGDIVVMGGGTDGGSIVPVKGGKAFPLMKGMIGTGPGQVYGASRSYGGHAGVDVVEKAPWGRDPKLPVLSYTKGKVISEKYKTSGYLSGLMVDHGNFQARYLHAKPSVRPGQTVQPGQKIANLIDLGNQTHLHFESYKGSQRMNPTGLLQAAYEKGGLTKDGPHIAMIGERGSEFVIDADSTAALEETFPGFLDAINKAKYNDAIQVLRNFVSYEQPYAEPEIQYIEVPVEVPVPVPTGSGGGVFVGGGIDNKVPGMETLDGIG